MGDGNDRISIDPAEADGPALPWDGADDAATVVAAPAAEPAPSMTVEPRHPIHVTQPVPADDPPLAPVAADTPPEPALEPAPAGVSPSPHADPVEEEEFDDDDDPIPLMLSADESTGRDAGDYSPLSRVLPYAAPRGADSAKQQGGHDVPEVVLDDTPQPPPEEELEPAAVEPVPGRGWSFCALCVGLALVACCIVIPQTDYNRRLVYEREKLRRDLDSIRRQVTTNQQFLDRVADDPNLAERLAQRQMKIIREGTRVLELKGPADDEMSPFHLVSVPPPDPLPPYQPKTGRLASLCYDARSRLYLMGAGLLLMAAGLVFGYAPRRE